MQTNTSITIYHKVYDKTNHIDIWNKQIISYAMWQGGKGASINKGYDKANDISVFIPYNKNNIENISIGDIIIKGEGSDITKQSDLEESFNITTLIDNKYGSYNMWHLQIGAK